MSIALLELAAATLGELTDEVVFTGGATIALWITDPAAPEPRPTNDVDIIVEVTSRGSFAAFEERLRARGFRNDQSSGLICRWRHVNSDIILDAMPTDGSILGFENRWQSTAVPHAMVRDLPSGTPIAAVPPPFLIATKLEAFAGRGAEDYVASRDFADIVSLIDGRAEIVGEIADSPAELRRYVASELSRHQAHWRFIDGVYANLLPDEASQARAERIVLPRMRTIVSEASQPNP